MKLCSLLGTLLTLAFATDLAAQATRPKGEVKGETATRPTPPIKQEEAFAGPKLDEKAFTHYGEGAHAGPVVTIQDVLAKPELYDGKSIRLGGTIGSVCQKKGCWMRVGEAGSDVFVRFKDYGFFMPLDSAGAEVVMEGVFKVTELSVAQQQHYLEDAKKFDEAKKVTQPKKEFSFMAQGVGMKNPPAAKTGEAKGGTPPAPAEGTKK